MRAAHTLIAWTAADAEDGEHAVPSRAAGKHRHRTAAQPWRSRLDRHVSCYGCGSCGRSTLPWFAREIRSIKIITM
jgi:hypothetical protein